ncbi:catalase-related domain-containing protein [Sorangium sp. So ce385]|uniref:catalase-related domain-containing protein n=1 Tax=Sorangium sp. So ce385 TaxID=3133308 RepID=UPI003F5CA9FA
MVPPCADNPRPRGTWRDDRRRQPPGMSPRAPAPRGPPPPARGPPLRPQSTPARRVLPCARALVTASPHAPPAPALARGRRAPRLPARRGRLPRRAAVAIGRGGWSDEERHHEGYGSREHPHPDHAAGTPGERYRAFEPWERDELVKNLVEALSQRDRAVQERMIGDLVQCDQDYGRRVAEGLSSRADGSPRARIDSAARGSPSSPRGRARRQRSRRSHCNDVRCLPRSNAAQPESTQGSPGDLRCAGPSVVGALPRARRRAAERTELPPERS